MTAGKQSANVFAGVDSFYAATGRPWSSSAALQGEATCEVAVVGGGFAGLWTARRLAQAGRSVVLIEGGAVGRAASGRNGGFVSAGFACDIDTVAERLGKDHAKSLYLLSAQGREAVRSFARTRPDHGIDMVNGRLKVLRYDSQGALKKRATRLARAYGQDMFYWPREKVREHLATDTYYEALEDPTGFHLHPLNLARALAADCVAKGARVHENTPVTGVRRAGSGWRVEASGGGVTAKHVVLACNVAAPGEGAVVSGRLARALLPVATYVVATERLGERLGEAIRWKGSIADTRRAGDYYRVVDGDRLLWGGRITTRIEEPADLAALMRADIARIYPQLAGAEVAYVWSGLMGYARHKMPIIGPLAKGLWACTAFGGHGLNTAAMGGEAVADAITGADDRVRLFEPFKPVWAGGPFGRVATQLEYWRLQLLDWQEERQARRSLAASLEGRAKSRVE